jgi:hypothetical protein
MRFLATDLPVWLDRALWATWGALLATVLQGRKRRLVRTTLESGATVDHIAIQDIKGKHIRDYARAGKSGINPDAVDDDGEIDVRALVTGTDLGEVQESKHDALWAICITAWSYDFPVPKFDRGSGETAGAEVLEEIPGDDYQEIDLLLQPFAKKLTARARPKEATTGGSSRSSRAKASGSRPG